MFSVLFNVKKWSAFALLYSMTMSVMASTIMVFGDSLSSGYGLSPGKGWVHLLETDISHHKRYRVINASIAGETSAGGLTRLPQVIQRTQPDVVILQLGGNDGLRGLPVSELKANLDKMIQLLQKKRIKVVLIGVRLPSNYGPAYNQQFAEVYASLAKRYRLVWVPSLMAGFELNQAMFQEDGIHPAAAAQPMMMRTVKQVLNIR